jgi:hypothetical protein
MGQGKPRVKRQPLKLPLSFEDALSSLLQTPPPEKKATPKRKPTRKKGR